MSDLNFNFQYALGTTIRNTRHTVYRDWDKKCQKEVHGKDISYWIDNDPKEYRSIEELTEAFNKKQQA
jgi:hypothetical protein